MKAPRRAVVENERPAQRLPSRAAAGSLLLHVLAVALFAWLGSRATLPPQARPAIEVELGFISPAPSPARANSAETAPKAVPPKKMPAPHPIPLPAPNPDAETVLAPPVHEPSGEKSAAAPLPASGAPSEPAGSSSGGDNRQPAAVFAPRPSYPAEARAGGREGKVRVKVLIGENGAPGEVLLAESSGSTSLDEAALAALRRWRFQPALRGGQPVPAWVTVPVYFSLR